MNILKDITEFLFPRECALCGKRLTGGERSICTNCLLVLPRTDYHTVEHSPLEKYFWTQFPIERAVSFFHHDGKGARQLIHLAKYKGRPNIGYDLAKIYAEELADTGFFSDIDCIVPVPLHWKRQLKRRYNQCEYIARGISAVTRLPLYNNVVKRTTNNASQTTVNHTERKDNVEGIFNLKRPELIEGKHVLLVDDVTTTGATIISCAKELAKANGVKISVLTLALASRSPLPLPKNYEADALVFGMPLME